MLYNPSDRVHLTTRALAETAYHRGRVDIQCPTDVCAQTLARQITATLRSWATSARFGNSFGQPSLAAVSLLVKASAITRDSQHYLSIARRGYCRDWVDLARALPRAYSEIIAELESAHTGETAALIRARFDEPAMYSAQTDAGLDYLSTLADSLSTQPQGQAWLDLPEDVYDDQ